MLKNYLFLSLLIFALSQDDPAELDEIVISFIRKFWKDTLKTVKPNITDYCFQNLTIAVNNPYDLFAQKFLKDSTKNENDVGSYQDCLTMSYKTKDNVYSSQIKKNISYIVFNVENSTLNKNGDVRSDLDSFMFGACLPKGCTNLDYKNIFYKACLNLNALEYLYYDDIKVINLNEGKIQFNGFTVLSMMPFVVILVIFFFSLIPAIPVKIFRCCFKKNHKNLILEKNKQIEKTTENISNFSEFVENNFNKVETHTNTMTDTSRVNAFAKCFDIAENSNTLMTNESKDNGLNIVNGLRGITMILMVIGNTFRTLYLSPIKIFCRVTFRDLITKYSFTLVIFGRRFGPALLFAYSGYVLIYKLFSYLDDQVENMEWKDLKRSDGSPTESQRVNKNSKDIVDSNDNLLISNDLSNKDGNFSLIYHAYNDYRKNLSVLLLLRFVGLQAYKYIIYILSILFFEFSFYTLFTISNSPGPIWVYFKINIIDRFNSLYMIAMVFLFSSFSNATNYTYDIFWMAGNEILYFLLSTVLLFYAYKKNLRLDIFLLILIFLLVVGKLIIYILAFPDILPSMVFQKHNFYYVLKNPVYNGNAYLIGLFFGMINYCVQRSISFEKLKKEQKSFLSLPIKFVLFFRTSRFFKAIFISIASFIALIVNIIAFNLIFRTFFMEDDENMTKFFTNFYVNLLFLFDAEVVPLLVFLFLIPLLLIGENFIFSCLKSSYWNIIAKPYFTYLLTSNMVIVYIFYQSETRVKIEFYNILFYSVLAIMILILLNAFCFIVFEIPLKKINKFILEKSNDSVEELLQPNNSEYNLKKD
jgi:hypothetical protein